MQCVVVFLIQYDFSGKFVTIVLQKINQNVMRNAGAVQAIQGLLGRIFSIQILDYFSKLSTPLVISQSGTNQSAHKIQHST